jgi:hypothetical protein
MTRKDSMDVCLTGDIIAGMIDGTLPGPDASIAAKHIESCATCSQLFSDMRDIEAALRREGDKVRIDITLSDIDRVVQGALLRTKETANCGIIMEYGKKHLLDVLGPVCGEHLTKRSMYLASQGTDVAGRVQTPETEWRAFVHELSNILASICGASVKHAVHHLAGEVLSGVA